MKPALGMLALLLLAAPACVCRQHRYFVDLERAVTETEEGKRVAAELARDVEAKRREFAEVDAAAKKAEDAKDADAAVKRARATETGQRLQREMEMQRDGSRAKLLANVKAALGKLANEHGVDAIDSAAGVAFVDADCELTAEVIKRLDGASGKSEIDELRAKVQALEKTKGKP